MDEKHILIKRIVTTEEEDTLVFDDFIFKGIH